MRESLAELFRELSNAGSLAAIATETGEYQRAQELLRQVLSAGSKLHSRMSVLAELADDAKFVAEVDRALTRAKSSGPVPLPGDQPLPFSPAGDPASGPPKKGRGPRKA